MDLGHTMDISTDADDQSKRQCYRCKVCFLSFTDSESLKEHSQKSCLNTQVMSENQALYESGLNALEKAMGDEKKSFDTLIDARAEANNVVMRYSEALKRKRFAEESHRNAVVRERNVSTVTVTEHTILSHIKNETLKEFKDALNELELVGREVNQTLRHLKELNLAAASATIAVRSAFSEVYQACKENLTATAIAQKADQELKNIRSLLESRHDILTELDNSVRELETVALNMLEDCSKKEHRTEDLSGRNPKQNALKRKLTDEDDEMDITMEKNLDEPKPSTSGAHKSESEKQMKKVSCARRLSFS